METEAIPAQPPVSSAPSWPWVPLAWFLGLWVALFLPVIVPMVREWVEMEEMGHAFFVPVVAGYVVWKERERLLRQPVKPFWGGLVVLAWGFLQMVIGHIGADFFIARIALLISLVGVIWTLAGTAVLRQLAFPLLLLLCMIRIPQFLYQQITFPLQLFASRVAETGLDLLSIPVLRDGNVLELPSQRLQVIEACSGIRSLISLSFLSLTYSYLFDPRVWMRPVLFLSTIPIAILANAFRVTLTGVLSEVDKDLADGVYHMLEGWVVFMVALALLVMLHRLILRVAPP
jgi:exosortase